MVRERGIHPAIYYANSNIAPADEYDRRLATLRTWAEGEGLPVVEGAYDPQKWAQAIDIATDGCPENPSDRKDRCRACYRLRFEEAAEYAAQHGYDTLGTTLSVSPYQYTDVIREELERACEQYGLQCAFEDYRPYYDEATRRSREAHMYRQNYCGCAYSAAEAAAERAERKAAREAKRAQWREEHAQERAAEEQRLAQRRAERRNYDAKRARQRAVLKELRAQRNAADAEDGSSSPKQGARQNSAETRETVKDTD